MSQSCNQSRIACSIDLDAQGKHQGDLLLRYSNNDRPLGFYPVPLFLIANGKGPTALLIAGVHGDEFEGPAALMRMVHSLSAEHIKGRLIILPTFNKPAVDESSRVSPLDQVNMNRAFPGDPNGGPSHMLAHYVETVLMPKCDLVIDLHTGGKASVFASCALASRTSDRELFEKNLDLAVAFGLPLIWLLGEFNDDRSVNSAALRNSIPMIATELGGGGGSDPVQIDLAEKGVKRCLQKAGILKHEIDPMQTPRYIEIASHSQNLYAPVSGLFERRFSATDEVEQGQHAGFIYPSDQPGVTPVALKFPESGLVLSHGNRGHVQRGDMLAMVATDAEDI